MKPFLLPTRRNGARALGTSVVLSCPVWLVACAQREYSSSSSEWSYNLNGYPIDEADVRRRFIEQWRAADLLVEEHPTGLLARRLDQRPNEGKPELYYFLTVAVRPREDHQFLHIWRSWEFPQHSFTTADEEWIDSVEKPVFDWINSQAVDPRRHTQDPEGANSPLSAR